MAGRTVIAKLAIDGVEGVVSGFRRAGSAVQEYAKVSQQRGAAAFSWVAKNEKSLNQLAGGLTKFGLVGGLAIAGVTKAAVDWESAWAGVTKTVDGTPEQLSQIEGGLRQLAKTLPSTHEEIAAVAEAAGQLGIQTENVLTFSKTMLDLGETTNMSADVAATTLARFMNVMGTSQDQVSRLGSVIVDLGNNFATTESEIATMAQRIAGVGAQMGMSESDVMGMAAAMSSVGIEAEAGGTAISTVMKKIDGAVRDGGSGLTDWADLAGVSANDFANAWRDDAGSAMASVVEGLGKVVSEGGSAAGVLGDLGIKGIRESDTMNRLALATEAAGASQNILRDALTSASTAWGENTALIEEAQKRYETPAAQMQMAINGIKDEAITLGATMLPVLNSMLGVFTDVLGIVGQVPGPVKAVGVQTLALASGAALAAAGLIKMVTGLVNAKRAIEAIGLSVGTATKAMGIIGVALTVAGAALAAWSAGQAEAKESVEGFSAAIKEQNGLLTEATRTEAARQAQQKGLLDLAERAGSSVTDVTDAILGNEEARNRLTVAIDKQIDANKDAIQGETLAGVTSSELQTRQEDLLKTKWDLANGVDELAGSFTVAADKQAQLSAASETSATQSEKDAEAKKTQAAAVQATAEELEDLLKLTQDYGNALLAMSGSQIAVESSIADLGKRIQELTGYTDENGKKIAGEFTASQIKAGKALDLTSEAGRKNQSALDQVAKSSMSLVETMFKQGRSSDDIAAATKRARGEWISAAKVMGMGRDRARELADAYFAIPDDASTTVSAPGASDAERKVKDLTAAINQVPKDKQTELRALLKSGDVPAVEDKLRELTKERTAKIQLKYYGGAPNSNYSPKGSVVHSANGNIVEYYADGDIRERHVAQIAPAGAERRWAEPETGGEAYIPLAQSKRPRSISIWKETGRRLGIAMASGGLLTPFQSPLSSMSSTSGILPTRDLQAFAKALLIATAPLKSLTAVSRAATSTANANTAAQKRVADAEKRLAAAEKRQEAAEKKAKSAKSKSSKAKAAKTVKSSQSATAAAKRDLDRAKSAAGKTDAAAVAASEKLRALAESAKSASAALQSTWMVGGDMADLLANMREGATGANTFSKLIERLRSAGLDEDLVKQIVEQGITAGTATASDILGKGRTGINDLNRAAANLKKATDNLGLVQVKRAGGGLISGPGTGTSDSIHARVSNGEYVMKASAVQHLGVGTLDYANRYGRLPASGGYSRTVSYSVPVDSGAIAQAVADGLADARIYMDGRVVDARIETRLSTTAARVRRGM